MVEVKNLTQAEMIIQVMAHRMKQKRSAGDDEIIRNALEAVTKFLKPLTEKGNDRERAENLYKMAIKLQASV